MATLIVNEGGVGMVISDGRGDSLGAYLQDYDPDFKDGVGMARWTYDEAQAKRFDTAADALAEWRRVSTVRPTRWDGKPNRPLTAWNVSFRTVGD